MSLLDKDVKPVSEVKEEVNALQKLLDFIYKLNERNIYHKLDCVRDAIMVEVVVPGERWEIEFFADGNVDIEIFRANGEMQGGEEAQQLLAQLFEENSD